MSEMAVYQDEYQADFQEELGFLAFLDQREQNATWSRRPAKELRFKGLKEDDVLTDLLRQSYAHVGREGVINDTMEHTRLLMWAAKEQYYPVRGCALKTIMDRAHISGNALSKIPKLELADILNKCMAVAEGEALMRISDGKVSAVHGGDKSDYAVLEAPPSSERQLGLYADVSAK